MHSSQFNVSEKVRVRLADLDQPVDQQTVYELTAMYAMDEMGNGQPLPDEVMARLIPALRAHPTTLIFLAFMDERAVGLATCFRGFSTFAARPLINIHDLAVRPECRGMGVGQALLRSVEMRAKEEGCAKLTLEVQNYNQRAQRAYAAFGFKHGAADEVGGPMFWHKPL